MIIQDPLAASCLNRKKDVHRGNAHFIKPSVLMNTSKNTF